MNLLNLCLLLCLVYDANCDESKCNGECDKNADWVECPSPCPATCESPNANQLCKMQCVKEGCQCKAGFILNQITNECVKPKHCPQDGGCRGDPNAVMTENECASACPPTCQDGNSMHSGIKACLAVCVVNPCVCKDGFCLDANTNKCVKPEDASS